MKKTEGKEERKTYGPLIQNVLTVLGPVICIPAYVLYSKTGGKLYHLIFIFFLVLFIHGLFRILVPSFLFLIFRYRFDPESFWFSEKSFERGLYERLNVKSWKSFVEKLSFHPHRFDMEKHDDAFILSYMCHAELCHEITIILDLMTCLMAGNIIEFIFLLILALVLVSLEMSFITVQRYNRPRLLRIKKRKEERGEILS